MTTIHISGAGGIINNEVMIISETLRRLGYQVTVDNPCADDDDVFEEICEHVKKFNSGGYNTDGIECPRMSVHITTTHIPWGG